METQIRAEGLWKAYRGVWVLQDVTFAAGVGVTCVMAPSGAGKTTLLRVLLGLERPDRGRVVLPAGPLAAVFQEDRLLEQLNALGNLRFVLGPALEVPAAETLLAELGLEEAADKPVRDWSGGMRRRLALARALLAPSAALLLDEPFTGLDRDSRERAWMCIRRRTADKPVLLVTHDPADAAGLEAQIIRL